MIRAIPFAISFNSIVLARLCVEITIIPLVLYPIENKIDKYGFDISALAFCQFKLLLENNGVKCSKARDHELICGSIPLILFTLLKGKYFSPFLGGLTLPNTVSPVIKPKKSICGLVTHKYPSGDDR